MFKLVSGLFSIRLADDTARNARDAAAEETTRDAIERIVRAEQIAYNALQLAGLLKLVLVDGVVAVDKRYLGKALDMESAPHWSQ